MLTEWTTAGRGEVVLGAHAVKVGGECFPNVQMIILSSPSYCYCLQLRTILVEDKYFLPDTMSSFSGRAQSRMMNEWQPSIATTVKL